MELNLNVSDIHWLNSSVEIALAVIILFKVKLLRVKLSLFACAVISVIWHSSVPDTISAGSLSWGFFLIESLRYLAWVIVLLHLLMLARGTKLPNIWAYGLYITLFITLSLFVFNSGGATLKKFNAKTKRTAMFNVCFIINILND